MAEGAVLYEVRDNIATITLNRPENRNSMTDDVLDGFIASVARVIEDASVRCVVVTGKGKSFCAGADFKSGAQRRVADLPPNERSFGMYRPFLTVLDIEVPVVGALNGHAIGGGMGLALVCDFRVANREAKYGVNFTKLGLHPGMATTYLLPRLVGLPKAAELILTGRIITGAEAAEMGLANYAVAPEEVWDKSWALAQEIAACAPIANRWAKRSLYNNADWDPVKAAQGEADLQSRTIETEDYREGVSALLEKRTPNFQSR
ncbi:MAG: enoyl-CoA hydratase/isomerase family protein [Candidatus Hydrogenedentes bacterium]|jgi:enoyl-CoA hydratase/carnithine racemase|nr:enoyl-CoA hydratase/isomerase family protein [Candidatus Hydrogenedentota bacterium]